MSQTKISMYAQQPYSILYTVTDTQRFERKLSCFSIADLTEKVLNPIDPSLLMNLAFTLELQKTLSSLEAEIEFFRGFPFFSVWPCRSLVANPVNNTWYK